MPKGDIETFHEDGFWHNRVEGESGTLGGKHITRADAVMAGRDAAKQRGVEHIVHNLNGRIGERDSHGHDPRDIKG